MPRTHESPCECDECYAEDLKDKFPDMECLQKYSAKEVAEIWTSYSDEASANWLCDDHIDTVFQVFYQADNFIKAGKPENFHWSTGRFFKKME